MGESHVYNHSFTSKLIDEKLYYTSKSLLLLVANVSGTILSVEESTKDSKVKALEYVTSMPYICCH